MALILIVDDDPTVRAIATELLRADDHAIVEASDGGEALALLARLPVDLVILDMLMPNVDGLETILSLKRQDSKVKILAISSGGVLDPTSLLKIAMTFGADAALQKPLRVGAFRDAVNRILHVEARQQSEQIVDQPISRPAARG
jgi:CheY-like chemotaxis protein